MKIHKTLFLILLFLNIFLYFPFKKVIAYSNEQACSGCSESTNCNVNCNTGCGRCYCDSGQSNGGNGHYSCIDSQWCNWCNGHNSSSSSSQSSSSAAQICTEGQRVLNNNHYYWCKTDNSTGRNFWSWIGEKTTPCSSSGYFQCNENSLTYQSCTKADDEIAYYWSNYYNSRCQFDNCTVSSFRYNGDGSVDQCIQGHGPNTRIGWLSWKGYKNGPCLINTYQCDDRNHTMNYCKDNSSKWFNSDDPCSFTGYPAPPARPGSSSSSSSQSSSSSSPSTCIISAVGMVRQPEYDSRSPMIETTPIKQYWVVRNKSYSLKVLGSSYFKLYSSPIDGISPTWTQTIFNPSSLGPLTASATDMTTSVSALNLPRLGRYLVACNAGSTEAANLCSGNPWQSYPTSGGVTDCGKDSHIVLNVVCDYSDIGNAVCDSNINEEDYQAWKCEYLGGGQCANPASNKTADFNGDTRVNLLDFEIWRENQAGEIRPTITPTD